MFTLISEGAAAPTVPPAQPTIPPARPPISAAEPIRRLLFGSLPAVRSTIKQLHKRGYAEPNDWSQPVSTGRPNEVMAILTKRVSSA